MEHDFRLDWVCTNGKVAAFSDRIAGEGGEVEGKKPFEPPPDELDLYADGQFEPLMVVTALVAAALGFKLIRETIKDLRGRQVMVIDVTDDTVKSRVLPLEGVDHVIVKSASGTETFSTAQTVDIENAILKALGK